MSRITGRGVAIVALILILGGAIAAGMIFTIDKATGNSVNGRANASYESYRSSVAAEETSARIQRVSARRAAEAACEDQVRKQLKSPATAQFTIERNDLTGIENDRLGGTISGSVDSQNGFGALMRSDWGCTIMPGSTSDNVIANVFYLNQRN